MNYALIDDGVIKVGPRTYHLYFFNEYLESQGIQSNLPATYESLDPIVVSPTISILPVTQLDMPEYHPITQQLSGPFWTIGADSVTGTMDVVPVPLDAAQNKMKELVAAMRYKKENSLVDVAVQGVNVKVSAARGYDREIWHQMMTLMTDTSTTLFKFTDPTTQWINLTKSDVVLVAATLAQHVQDWFTWENQKVSEIEQADAAGLEELYSELVQPAVE